MNTLHTSTLVLGGTGKTGRRVVERLQARGLSARVGSRAGEPPFDRGDRSTWFLDIEQHAAELRGHGVPGEVVELLTYVFGEVLDRRNADTTEGVREALGREPRDFASYAAGAVAPGAWSAVPSASR